MEHLLSSANIEQLTKQVIEFVITAPTKYKTWWNNLYSDSPEHIFIETGLILFIIWLVFIRSTIDPTKAATNAQLTERDIDYLVDTWEPEPMVPALPQKLKNVSNNIKVL